MQPRATFSCAPKPVAAKEESPRSFCSSKKTAALERAAVESMRGYGGSEALFQFDEPEAPDDIVRSFVGVVFGDKRAVAGDVRRISVQDVVRADRQRGAAKPAAAKVR